MVDKTSHVSSRFVLVTSGKGALCSDVCRLSGLRASSDGRAFIRRHRATGVTEIGHRVSARVSRTLDNSVILRKTNHLSSGPHCAHS